MIRVHVIPVPAGYTAEDAFLEIGVFDELRCSWWRRRWPFLSWAVVEDRRS